MNRYWRIRVKDGNGTDHTKEAWELGKIGVWYGAWSADDLTSATSKFDGRTEKEEIARYLSETPSQVSLEWKSGVTRSMVDTAIRFKNIEESDWIVVYLAESMEIGVAKIAGKIHSQADCQLNEKTKDGKLGEVYKFCEIVKKKTFHLLDLPDAYLLLPSQGRGNVHEFHGMHEHVEILARSNNVQEANAALRKKGFEGFLDFMGASEWESICLAYLIITEGFIPMGLVVGKTLPVVDIVGRRLSDGARIYGQCKKHPYKVEVEADFERLANVLHPSDKAIYFAYSGCLDAPSNVSVVTKKEIVAWANSELGARYRDALMGTQ